MPTNSISNNNNHKQTPYRAHGVVCGIFVVLRPAVRVIDESHELLQNALQQRLLRLQILLEMNSHLQQKINTCVVCVCVCVHII